MKLAAGRHHERRHRAAPDRQQRGGRQPLLRDPLPGARPLRVPAGGDPQGAAHERTPERPRGGPPAGGGGRGGGGGGGGGVRVVLGWGEEEEKPRQRWQSPHLIDTVSVLLEAYGVSAVTVPATFPLEHGDRLREKRVSVTARPDPFFP